MTRAELAAALELDRLSAEDQMRMLRMYDAFLSKALTPEQIEPHLHPVDRASLDRLFDEAGV